MHKTTPKKASPVQIKLIRKYLKFKIQKDNVTFRNHSSERSNVYDIMKRTILFGESHSALVFGTRSIGKTTLINSVLHQLSEEIDIARDAYIVKLNGLMHGDEKIALKAITAQMQLENAVGDRVFGNFADNLAFLVSCLQSGTDRRCKSMVFILEDFDMFCHNKQNQTLLYNLFDITHHQEAPVCVLGITSRPDVMELLEKRVKSRFSHRHIYIFTRETSSQQCYSTPVVNYTDLLVRLLSIPLSVAREKEVKKGRGKKAISILEEMEIDEDPYSLSEDVLQRWNVDSGQFSELEYSHVENWNAHVRNLAKEEKVVNCLERFCYFDAYEQVFRNVLFRLVCKLTPRKPCIDPSDFSQSIHNVIEPEYGVKQLLTLSIVQLSLVIAMMHGMEIFDGQPMNFEMVLHRYKEFANANSSTQTFPRPVILKAFEHLHYLDIIAPIKQDSFTDTTASSVQKEYKLYILNVTVNDIKEAVKGFKALPTEIAHWANNSVF